MALLSATAWADRNPDFDDDAKPLLRIQPHLLHFVEHTFEVQDTGVARVPGDEHRPPLPPFIFKARPRGTSGAYFITLLIQPGPPGHVLKVVDPTQPHGRFPGLTEPNEAPEPSPEEPAAASPAIQKPAPTQPAASQPVTSQPASPPSASTPSGPTAATPSGPIQDSGNSTNPPSLAPPPDPSPPSQ